MKKTAVTTDDTLAIIGNLISVGDNSLKNYNNTGYLKLISDYIGQQFSATFKKMVAEYFFQSLYGELLRFAFERITCIF